MPSNIMKYGTTRTSREVQATDSNPVEQIKKSVSYVASGTDSNQILSISSTDSSSAVKSAIPRSISVKNTGLVPVIAMFVYEEYSDDDTDAGQATLHTMIMPNEEIFPTVIGAIKEAGNNPLQMLDGTVVDFTAPNTALKVDSGDNVASGELNNTTDPVVFELDNGHEKYRVGDYIRVENEILKVEGTYDDNPTTSSVADNHIVVSRAHFGSTAASHSGTPDVYFPIFNEYYDYDIILSGSSQLVQSDSMGRYKSSNFYSYGRADATADNQTFGIVAGSVAFRFHSKAYQDVCLGGTGTAGGTGGSNMYITGSTDSGLSASTAYAFDITIDDSSSTTVSFTTGADVTFGANEGIVKKINDALETAFKTAGNGLFGYGCVVSVADGKLRFESNSNLSKHDGTNGSKIALADASSGTNLFSGTAGKFPDILNVSSPIDPVISPVATYDRITYNKNPNLDALCYDNGIGDLVYKNQIVGGINYETGEHNFTIPELPNAQFEVQVAHSTPFAGKLDNVKEDSNVLVGVHANVLNKNITGELEIKVY